MLKKIVFLVLFFYLSAFSIHKFYVSIYQFTLNENKKRIEITSRIFIDDLNTVLSKKFKTKIQIDDTLISENNQNILTQYLKEKLIIKVNNQFKEIVFKSCEIESNVLICYLSCPNISKIKTIEIKNEVLLELNNEQQNINQTTFYNKKESFVTTIENVKTMLKMK